MIKFMFMVYLLCTIQQSYGQSVGALLPGYFSYSYNFPLQHGEQMKMELVNSTDIQYLLHTDSLVSFYLQDMRRLKDSLQEEIETRRIEHISNGLKPRTIMVKKISLPETGYVVDNNLVAYYKSAQDTIVMTCAIKGTGISHDPIR